MTDLVDLTRPIIGIENRTAQEVFDMMCDRIRYAIRSLYQPEGSVGAKTWCPTCGGPSPDGDDCLTCARWWRDNPPPSDSNAESVEGSAGASVGPGYSAEPEPEVSALSGEYPSRGESA